VPADINYGQAERKLRQRKKIKSKTLKARKNNIKNYY